MIGLQARDVTVRIGDAVLLRAVDLEAHPHELIAIVGPNGAGKSTLLEVLAGERTPTSGRVEIDGVPIADHHPSELSRLRAFLHRSEPNVPFSVRHVVSLGRNPHRHDPDNDSDRDRRAVAVAMRLAGIEHLASRTFASLSGGEQMRASIARVLAQDAPLMFLDEPTGPLDVASRERILHMLRAESIQGRAVITVLHDLNTAATHATRIVLIAGGHIVTQGHPREVLRADILTEVYEHRMHVVEHPVSAGPLVVADPGEPGDT